MGPFITAAIAAAAFVKGAFLGAVVGAAVACACQRARSRGALDHPETAEPQEG